jgi:hypothetical protein
MGLRERDGVFQSSLADALEVTTAKAIERDFEFLHLDPYSFEEPKHQIQAMRLIQSVSHDVKRVQSATDDRVLRKRETDTQIQTILKRLRASEERLTVEAKASHDGRDD